MVRYFVAYAHSQGFGSAQINRPEPITCFADIQNVIAAVENNYPHLYGICVLTFQRFDEPAKDTVT